MTGVTVENPGSDIRQRRHLVDALVASDVWAEWTDLSESADLRERIAAPGYSGTGQLPAIVLNNGGSRRWLDDHDAVKAEGVILLQVYDVAADAETAAELNADEERFAGNFSALIDELVSYPKQFGGVQKIVEVLLQSDAIVRTEMNTQHDLDVSDAERDSGGLFEGPVWIGTAFVTWGPLR